MQLHCTDHLKTYIKVNIPMTLDFSKLGNGLIPAIIQDAQSNTVLMLGFMNEEALAKTKELGKVTFFSRTKQRLWTKGEESGNFLNVVSIASDCDDDTLLIKANPVGPVCHTGNDTCFNETNKSRSDIRFLTQLQDVIDQRKRDMPKGSYTTTLFEKGINRIAQKVGEEAVETVIEAKDNNDDLFLNEVADLTYHLEVLLTAKGFRIEDVVEILQKRHS
jgi:phosphoribosyl-ATP pyrophosphohydrolase/phosphoribosyl-AMP cyclohydrolase